MSSGRLAASLSEMSVIVGFISRDWEICCVVTHSEIREVFREMTLDLWKCFWDRIERLRLRSEAVAAARLVLTDSLLRWEVTRVPGLGE